MSLVGGMPYTVIQDPMETREGDISTCTSQTVGRGPGMSTTWGEGSAPVGPCCAGLNLAEGLKPSFMWACSMYCRIKIVIHLLYLAC